VPGRRSRSSPREAGNLKIKRSADLTLLLLAFLRSFLPFRHGRSPCWLVDGRTPIRPIRLPRSDPPGGGRPRSRAIVVGGNSIPRRRSGGERRRSKRGPRARMQRAIVPAGVGHRKRFPSFHRLTRSADQVELPANRSTSSINRHLKNFSIIFVERRRAESISNRADVDRESRRRVFFAIARERNVVSARACAMRDGTLIGIARALARNDADRVRPAPMGARAAALHGEKSPARAAQTRPR